MKYLDTKSWNKFFKGLAAVFVLVLFAGCVAGGNYGSLAFDRELDNKFESYQVLPDHNYYITGGYNAPAAILAIHGDYQLINDANLWVPVPDVNQTYMQRWIKNLSPEVGFWEKNQFLAFYILNLEGKRVGAWYSGERSATVQFFEDNRIKVYPPDMKPSFGGDHGDIIPK